MAANHTTHESLAESPLNFAVSEGDLSVKLKVEEMVRRTMIMLQEMMQRTESQNDFGEASVFLDNHFSDEFTAPNSNRDTVSRLSVNEEAADSHIWSQKTTDPMHFSATPDSYSSIFDAAGSPTSVNI